MASLNLVNPSEDPNFLPSHHLLAYSTPSQQPLKVHSLDLVNLLCFHLHLRIRVCFPQKAKLEPFLKLRVISRRVCSLRALQDNRVVLLLFLRNRTNRKEECFSPQIRVIYSSQKEVLSLSLIKLRLLTQNNLLLYGARKVQVLPSINQLRLLRTMRLQNELFGVISLNLSLFLM